MIEPSIPYPLFPPLGLLNDHVQAERPINLEIRRRLEAVPEHLNALNAWQTGMRFLINKSEQPGFEDRHYKKLCPIVESMMHWSWSIRGKALDNWESDDAIAFIEFIMRPPIAWVTTPGCSRYSKKTRGNFADKPLDPLWRSPRWQATRTYPCGRSVRRRPSSLRSRVSSPGTSRQPTPSKISPKLILPAPIWPHGSHLPRAPDCSKVRFILAGDSSFLFSSCPTSNAMRNSDTSATD